MEFIRASLSGFLIIVIAISLGGCVTNKPLFDPEDQMQSVYDSYELNCFIEADHMVEDRIRALNLYSKSVENCYKELVSRIKVVYPDDPEFDTFKKNSMFILQEDGGYFHLQKVLLINQADYLKFRLNMDEKDFKEEISHPVALLSPIAKNAIEESYTKEQKRLLEQFIKKMKQVIRRINATGIPSYYINNLKE